MNRVTAYNRPSPKGEYALRASGPIRCKKCCSGDLNYRAAVRSPRPAHQNQKGEKHERVLQDSDSVQA